MEKILQKLNIKLPFACEGSGAVAVLAKKEDSLVAVSGNNGIAFAQCAGYVSPSDAAGFEVISRFGAEEFSLSEVAELEAVDAAGKKVSCTVFCADLFGRVLASVTAFGEASIDGIKKEIYSLTHAPVNA